MVVFLRSLDCNPDPRVQKYCDYLSKKNLSYRILCWDRNVKYVDDNLHSYFHRKALYGTGLKNSIGLLKFNFFLIRYLVKKRKTYDVIHACDFDTILPAILLKLLFGKKIVYDIFDWFVDSRHFKNKLIKGTVLFLEKLCLKMSDAVIICDEKRREQLNFMPRRLWVLPNIPNFNFELDVDCVKNNKVASKIILSYVGTMPADRGIDKLLKCVSEDASLELHIAGFGIMDSLVKSCSEKNPNIYFYGTVPYEKGMEIMNHSDIIIAIYEKLVLNNVFAAPNKYYEGLFLGKPILTTKGTLVGEHTEKNYTGFVIGEGLEEMQAFFRQEGLKDSISICGQNAKKLWENKYCNCVSNFMNKTYIPFILNLN